ncbi:MAG: preprotein translocase subunit YajC [Clostridiales bacterium]|nr:preprotein translocase subunit YajC [Clostridiales bacterium]
MLLAAAGAQGPEGFMGILMNLLPFIVIIGVFYFLMIRPQRKRDKENREMLAALTTGDNITTIGGICGKIVSVNDDIVVIEVGADKVKLVFERWAIKSVDKITAD